MSLLFLTFQSSCGLQGGCQPLSLQKMFLLTLFSYCNEPVQQRSIGANVIVPFPHVKAGLIKRLWLATVRECTSKCLQICFFFFSFLSKFKMVAGECHNPNLKTKQVLFFSPHSGFNLYLFPEVLTHVLLDGREMYYACR